MKRVLILGSAGMAGHIMAEYFSVTGKYEVFGVDLTESRFTRKIIDVTQFDLLESYINDTKPLYVINCIGILVDKSASDIKSAILINSYLPHFLSDLGNKAGYKLVHLSTDCVFSGKEGNYHENSFRDGDDNYARTKALGEVINNKDLTIRTSIIGPEIKFNGLGLLDWFLKQNNPINGYSRVFWTGITTLELAKVIDQMLDLNIAGLYHLCTKQKISKYDLLKLFAEIFQKKLIIDKDDNYVIDKSIISTRNDFLYSDIEYKKMFDELRQWMLKRNELYSHYGI